jgi:hypothetical protein
MLASNFIESRLASAVINELPQNLKVTHCLLSKFPCKEMGLFFLVYCRILHDSKIDNISIIKVASTNIALKHFEATNPEFFGNLIFLEKGGHRSGRSS